MSARERAALALSALGVVFAVAGAFTISPGVGIVTLGGVMLYLGVALGDV